MRSFVPSSAVLGPWAAALAAVLALATAPAAARDPAEAAQTFLAARAWLDAGGESPAVSAPAGVRAAAVVLRLHGRLLGIGSDAGGGPVEGTVDRALRAAFADASEKSRSRPAAPPDAAGLGRAVTLELELAGERVPLIGRTFEEATRALEPGACGLQLVDGDRTAYLPASVMLARQMATPVSNGVLWLVRTLELPARDLPDLQALGGRTALYASPSIRMAETKPGAAPVLPCRILPAVAAEKPPRAWAADACDRIVARLERQLEVPPAAEGVPADAAAQLARTGLRGDYVIAADRYEPFTAGPEDQALAAWSLVRAGATAELPQPLRDRCAATGRRVLAALSDVDPSERDPAADPVAVACTVLAMAELGGDAGLPGPFTAGIRAALAKATEPAALEVARPHVRALLLDAAAARAGDGTPPMERARLDAEIARSLADMQPASLPAAAPFLFDALLRLHGAAWRESVAAQQRAAIDAARTVLVATQLQAPAAEAGVPGAPEDVSGAYPATGSAAGRASSQSLRMQLFVAMLAGQPGTRSDARDAEDRDSLGRANRFVRQLLATPAIAAAGPAPDRAIGGVLASPPEASQPLAAQAMALLALAETERAHARLDAPAAGSGGNAGSAPAR